jgi:hypothetical protein
MPSLRWATLHVVVGHYLSFFFSATSGIMICIRAFQKPYRGWKGVASVLRTWYNFYTAFFDIARRMTTQAKGVYMTRGPLLALDDGRKPWNGRMSFAVQMGTEGTERGSRSVCISSGGRRWRHTQEAGAPHSLRRHYWVAIHTRWNR